MTRLADLQASFVAPPRVTWARPRDVELTAAGRLLVAVALLMMVGGLAAGLLLQQEAARQAANRRALVNEGVMVTGEVARLWPTGDNRRRVEYRFEAGGRVYTGRARVSEARRRTLQVGSPLPVRYVPANPSLHDLGGAPREGLPPLVPAIVAAALISGGVLALAALGRQRRLLTDGRLAPAIVTSHKTKKTQHGTQRSLTFDFVLPSGRVVSGKSATSKAPPAVGEALCVVYDPERPQRNRIYPFPLVRPS